MKKCGYVALLFELKYISVYNRNMKGSAFMDPIQKISVNYNSLTFTEKKTCNLIVKNPEIVIDNPIAEAAEIYGVSPSSILRLAKKLEYKGYSEFRYALEAFKDKEEKGYTENTTANKVIHTYQHTLEDMPSFIEEEKLIELVKLMHQYRLRTVGIGNSSLPAKQLVYSLYAEGKWAECISDTVRINFIEDSITEEDFIIVFSVSGKSISSGIIESWRKKGTKVVMITANPQAETRHAYDLVFVVPSLPLTVLQKDATPKYLENRSIFYIFIDIIMSYYLIYKNS